MRSSNAITPSRAIELMRGQISIGDLPPETKQTRAGGTLSRPRKQLQSYGIRIK